MDGGERFTLRSEFAVVEVQHDVDANGDRLRITDLRSGRTLWLDPLELERLTAASHADLAYLVAPALDDAGFGDLL